MVWKNIKKDIPEQEYDFVDFFCGAGGMSYGFHKMAELTGRLRWAGAIDIDKHAIDTYEHNYGHRPQNVNLGEADISEIRNALDLKEGNELILIGCAPCQGFSSHRKKDHRGPDSRNTLVGRFAEIAVELNPKMIIMENVPDLLAKKHWHHYQAFKDTVEAAGYHIAVKILGNTGRGCCQRQRLLSPGSAMPRHRSIVEFSNRRRCLRSNLIRIYMCMKIDYHFMCLVKYIG